MQKGIKSWIVVLDMLVKIAVLISVLPVNIFNQNRPNVTERVLDYGETKENRGIYLKLKDNATENNIDMLWSNVLTWVELLPFNNDIF